MLDIRGVTAPKNVNIFFYSDHTYGHFVQQYELISANDPFNRLNFTLLIFARVDWLGVIKTYGSGGGGGSKG